MDLKGRKRPRKILAVFCEKESFPNILGASTSYTVVDRVSRANMTLRGRAVPFAGNHCRADQGRRITRRHGTSATMGRRIEMQRAHLASPRDLACLGVLCRPRL